jgi:hypothetical protein
MKENILTQFPGDLEQLSAATGYKPFHAYFVFVGVALSVFRLVDPRFRSRLHSFTNLGKLKMFILNKDVHLQL